MWIIEPAKGELTIEPGCWLYGTTADVELFPPDDEPMQRLEAHLTH